MMRLVLLLLTAALASAAEPAFRLPPTLACCAGFERRVVVDIGDTPVADITIRATPAGQLSVEPRPGGERRLELRLRPTGEVDGQLELLDRRQATRARCAVRTVALSTDSSKSINSEPAQPDGTVVFYGQLILKPYVPGIDVRFACLSTKVTVPDGLAERWIASETFTPDAAGTSASTTFRMVRQPGAKWVPYTYILYQDGEQIGPE